MNFGGNNEPKTEKDSFHDKKKASQDAVNRIVSEVSQRGKNLLDEGIENARHVFQENADVIKEKAEEISDKSIEEISEDVKYYVRRNPLQSMAVALGLGVVLGFILKSD